MEEIIGAGTYDTYGLKFDELEAARKWVEEKLGISLKLYNSSYLGGDYYRNGNSYELIKNCFDYDGDEDWIEEEHQEYGIILRVNNLPNYNEIRDKLLNNSSNAISLLSHCCITEYKEYRISREYKYVDSEYLLYEELKINKWF